MARHRISVRVNTPKVPRAPKVSDLKPSAVKDAQSAIKGAQKVAGKVGLSTSSKPARTSPSGYSRGTMTRRGRVGDEAIAVQGLSGLQRAFRRMEGGADKWLRAELRGILAETVLPRARANVTHETGRHGGSGIELARSLRISVQARGASLYTTAPHGWVQDRGGKVGRGGATLLQRGNVSQYMTRATRESGPEVDRRLNGLLDRIERDWGRA